MFDFVILGATGFTGKWVVEEGMFLITFLNDLEYVKTADLDVFSKKISNFSFRNVDQARKTDYNFAVAGRNCSNLEKLHSNVIVCDIKDDESVLKMVNQCKVLVNCTGPYRLLGEGVLSACVKRIFCFQSPNSKTKVNPRS